MRENLYGKFTGHREKEVLDTFSNIEWFKSSVKRINYEDQTEWHDGSILLNDGNAVLIEIQHIREERFGVCLDIISVFYCDALRGKAIPGKDSIGFLKSISKNVKTWGKFLNKSFDSDIIVFKVESTNHILIYSTRKIAEIFNNLLNKYGFRVNKKSKISDKHDSAFIPVPILELKDCIIDNYAKLLNELSSNQNKFCDLGFN